MRDSVASGCLRLSIPKPSAEVSYCSGKISPKSRPCEWIVFDEVGGRDCCGVVVLGDGCVIEGDDFGFPLVALRGLARRLANDCELFDT